MRRVMLLVFQRLSHCAFLFISLSVSAEPTYHKKNTPAFPSGTVLNIQFDEENALRFQWAATEGATLHHLQERTEGNDHFTDLAANLPSDMLHYRITPPLYGSSTHHYRLLSCNVVGCKPSNVLTLHHNSMSNLVEWLLTQSDDLFGAALSLNNAGTVLAVGAPSSQYNRIQSNSSSAGSVYLFDHSEGHWNAPIILKPPRSIDRFGYPVQLDKDGQVLAVGSRKDQRSVTEIFMRKGMHQWRRSDYSPSADNRLANHPTLANSLSESGHVLAIASQYELVNHRGNAAKNDPGQSSGPVRFVQIFERKKNGWQEPQLIRPDRSELESVFGYAISLSGDGQALAIGAPALRDNDDQYSRIRGAVYLYQRSATGHWQLQNTLHSTAPHNAISFGHSVSLNGNGTVLAIGAFEHSDKTSSKNIGTGLVQVFTRTTSADWQLNKVLRAPGDQVQKAAFDQNHISHIERLN